MPDLRVAPGVVIPENELELFFTRSSGPGGQHVNTSATRVELRFDVAASRSLTPEQRARIRARLGPRLSVTGVLRLTDSSTRSQARNREAVLVRLAALLRDALAPPPPPRRPTRPTAAAQRRRAERKQRQSERKALRRRIDPAA